MEASLPTPKGFGSCGWRGAARWERDLDPESSSLRVSASPREPPSNSARARSAVQRRDRSRARAGGVGAGRVRGRSIMLFNTIDVSVPSTPGICRSRSMSSSSAGGLATRTLSTMLFGPATEWHSSIASTAASAEISSEHGLLERSPTYASTCSPNAVASTSTVHRRITPSRSSRRNRSCTDDGASPTSRARSSSRWFASRRTASTRARSVLSSSMRRGVRGDTEEYSAELPLSRRKL